MFGLYSVFTGTQTAHLTVHILMPHDLVVRAGTGIPALWKAPRAGGHKAARYRDVEAGARADHRDLDTFVDLCEHVVGMPPCSWPSSSTSMYETTVGQIASRVGAIEQRDMYVHP